MAVFYKINNVDFDDYFVRRDLFSQGNLWGWGANYSGELGTNAVGYSSSPVQTVAGGVNWKQVAGGGSHTSAIKVDGTLWIWGLNTNGQLGDNTVVRKSSPVQTVSGGTNWKQVSCGDDFTAAIKTDGTLWLWGINDNGQLGNNNRTKQSSPVQTISGGSNWKQVECGKYTTSAIKTDGTLWLWGLGWYGMLGDNTVADKSSPVQTVAGGNDWQQVSCFGAHTAALKIDGSLWTWGRNNSGQLGDNTVVDKSSPIQTIAGGTNWKQVACGDGFTTAIKADGTLWVWGVNDYGQLGNNTVDSKSSPIQTVTGGTNWKQVSAGVLHTSAIKTDGTLWTWGYNEDGALGDNSLISKSTPVQTVAGGIDWRVVACGQWNTFAITDIY